MLRSTVPCCLTLASTKHLSLTSTSASFFTMWTCCQKIIAISITAIHHRDICQTPWINFTIGKYLGPVHTNAFSLSSKTHRSFDAYTTVLMPFRLFKCTKTLENDRITRCDVSWTLCACYKHTHPRYFLVIVFVLRRFRPSALIRYVCVITERQSHHFYHYLLFIYSLPYGHFFGGVEALSREHFELINGFSNIFWGWGGEDDNLYFR